MSIYVVKTTLHLENISENSFVAIKHISVPGIWTICGNLSEV